MSSEALPTLLTAGVKGVAKVNSWEHAWTSFCQAIDRKQICAAFSDLRRQFPSEHTGLFNLIPLLCQLNSKNGGDKLLQSLQARCTLCCSEQPLKGQQVAIIGAGPVGLVCAIETAFLGAHVEVFEMRDSFTRMNILRLWDWTYQYLLSLGAAELLPRLLSYRDHCGIHELQALLLKVCLLLGVHVHWNTSFQDLQSVGSGREIVVQSHIPGRKESSIATHKFSALIATDSCNSAVAGSIGVPYVRDDGSDEEPLWEVSLVVHFENLDQDEDKHMARMARSVENGAIEGVSTVMYFTGETHYFIMAVPLNTLEKFKVFRDSNLPLSDSNSKAALLDPSNIVLDNVKAFALDVATKYSNIASNMEQLFGERLSFNSGLWQHRKIANDPLGRPAVSVFRYTRDLRHASIPLVELDGGMPVFFAGDALHEPLWLRGEGCSRGFLGGFDTVWTLCKWAHGLRGDALIDQREKLIELEARLEANLKREGENIILPHIRYPFGVEWGFDGKRRPGKYVYTIDPATRYVASFEEQRLFTQLFTKLQYAAPIC